VRIIASLPWSDTDKPPRDLDEAARRLPSVMAAEILNRADSFDRNGKISASELQTLGGGVFAPFLAWLSQRDGESRRSRLKQYTRGGCMRLPDLEAACRAYLTAEDEVQLGPRRLSHDLGEAWHPLLKLGLEIDDPQEQSLEDFGIFFQNHNRAATPFSKNSARASKWRHHNRRCVSVPLCKTPLPGGIGRPVELSRPLLHDATSIFLRGFSRGAPPGQQRPPTLSANTLEAIDAEAFIDHFLEETEPSPTSRPAPPASEHTPSPIQQGASLKAFDPQDLLVVNPLSPKGERSEGISSAEAMPALEKEALAEVNIPSTRPEARLISSIKIDCITADIL